MAYLSLYRKYRSQTFDDVMGQEHVTRTLQNAIRLGKVAHAYLFSGTRGTGKTTTARLLAKALNCDKGPTPEPCNECPACISITEGTAMDIVEMDAASHRSIRDVEEIRENVKFPPMELRHKIFIIDEAHQLSGDAKDAFLKTLEEPPSHTIFVLATTEPQSIPITIRSRCQHFEFRRGSLGDIRERLRFVTENEGVEADDAALDLMAANAEGSWRDALIVLEQVLAYTDGRISAEDVHTVLGTVTQDFLFRLADILAAQDERAAFEAAAEIVEAGKEVPQLLRSMAQHLRNLLFTQVAGKQDDPPGGDGTASRLREQAAKFGRQALLRMVEVFSEADRDARFSDHHSLLLELALLKAIEVARPAQATPPAPQQKTEQQKPRREQAYTAERADRNASAPAPSAAPVQHKLPEFDKIKDRWNVVLQHIKSLDRPAHGLISDAVPAGLRNGALVLHFKYQSHVDIMNKGGDNPKRKALVNALQQAFGVAEASVICEVGMPEQPALMVSAAADGGEDDLPNPFEDNGQTTLSDVLEIFPNAEIVDE